MAASAALLLEPPHIHYPIFRKRNNIEFRSSSLSTFPTSFSSLKWACYAGTIEPEPASGENPNLYLDASTDAPANDKTGVNFGSKDGRKDRKKTVRIAWEKLVRWSRSWRSKANTDVLQSTKKVVILGGGSFGTAMAAHIASRKAEMQVLMLVRDVNVCCSINESHFNCNYFPDHKLPDNVVATTDPRDALLGADFCLHAVPVQFSSSFLEGISQHVDPKLPFISLSKGLELNTLRMMSQVIPQALRNPRQPFTVLSGPSFALELMNKLPTGVEITGALKNVLAIAAGIVEGMDLGNNCMAALVAQGCSEIRWLAIKNCWVATWLWREA